MLMLFLSGGDTASVWNSTEHDNITASDTYCNDPHIDLYIGICHNTFSKAPSWNRIQKIRKLDWFLVLVIYSQIQLPVCM